ncbi:MAG: O-antigen ligase family protein [Thermoleophilaceae bacterium]
MATAPPRVRPTLPRLALRVPRGRPGAAEIAALGLGAAIAYAAFADGAIALPNEARLQVGVAALALFGLGALLFAPRLRAAAPLSGWSGVALLALFTVWTGVTLAWSIAPDGTWAELNRALDYTLVAAVALVVGSSLPHALERAAIGYLVIAAAVALYALGGKAIPSFHVGGLIDLNHTAFFSRLRAPLAYWNALALFCALAVPIALRAAAGAARGRTGRAAAVVSLVLLLTTIGLTYSRGGFAALAVAVIVMLALGPERLRTAAVAAAGAVGTAPALIVAFTRHDLTHDLVPVARRTADGLLFAAALAAGCVAAVVIARLLEQRADRVATTLPRRRALGLAGAAAALAVVAVVALLAASDRGIGGTVSHEVSSFKSVKYQRQNDPARILQTNSGNRWVWWGEAVGAWADRPVGGWGAGSFPLIHHRYRHNALEVLQPHSVPLQFLAETGVVGALLALAALALLTTAAGRRAAAGVRAARAGIPPGREHGYAVALLAAVLAWLVHMWFDWDWDIPGVTLPLVAFLGLLAARPLGAPALALAPARSGPVIGRRVAALVLGAALAAAVAVSAALPSLANDHLQSATAAFASGNLEEAVREADIARRLDPVDVDGLLLESRAAVRRTQFRLAARLLTDAVHRQPDNPDVWFDVGRLELIAGNLAKMRAAARRMLVLDPVGSYGRVFFLSNDLGARSATATGTPLP